MEREAEQGLVGLKGRASQPQATYIHQPQVRVSHDHIHHAAGQLLLVDGCVSHCVDGCQDDVRPLRRLEVFAQGLWEEGMEQRQITLSTLILLLSWAAKATLARNARQCWWQCPPESWQLGLQSLHGEG